MRVCGTILQTHNRRVQPWRSFLEVSMLYAVLFEDDPDRAAEIRREFMPAHLAFLERNGERIMAAGPLRSPTGDSAGGLWLVDAAHPDGVDALVKEDPFWPTGLRKSVRVLAWSQVFANGQRLI
jgi:uncharacterized protein YciI